MGICVFTVLTIYWKHPFQGYVRHTRILDQQYGYLLRGYGLSFQKFTFVSMIGNYVVDIVFCAAVYYFLSRPQVRSLFSKLPAAGHTPDKSGVKP
jgi:hypothetical protein